jgi:hypothetical protein
MILDRFDHYTVLRSRRRDLHTPGAANGRVRNISVARDLIARVDDNHTAMKIVREHAQHGRLTDSWPAQQQEAFARLDQIANDGNRSVDRAADAAREADNLAAPVPNRGDSMQRAFDACAVVVAKLTDSRGDVLDLLPGDIGFADVEFSVLEAGFGTSAEIHDDLDKASTGTINSELVNAISNPGWQHREQVIQIVSDLMLGDGELFEIHCWF